MSDAKTVVGRVNRARGVIVYEAREVEGVRVTKEGQTSDLDEIAILIDSFLSIGVEGTNGAPLGLWEFEGTELGMKVNGVLFGHEGMSGYEPRGQVRYSGTLPKA